MATLIQIRRGTSSQWSSANPVLASGELAISTDLEKIKIGNGTSTWSNLLYINLTPDEIQSAINSSVSSVIDGAPALLDTLNELAAALGDDENFASTITNSLSDKLDISTASSTYLTQANAASSYDAIGSASAAQAAAESYADGLAPNYDPAGSASAVSSDLSDHELSTISVHGITNTENLIYTDDSRLSDNRTPTDNSVTSAKIVDGTIVNADINANAEIAQSKIASLTSDLSAKAPISSPALTGTPTAPTATEGTNTTQVATTAFVSTAVSGLIDSSPATLDTLNELAAALGDDPNFATTVSTSIGNKANIDSPTFTGTPFAPTPSAANNTTQIATTAYVKSQGYTTNTGTVTSVGITVPTGISITGSPITTSGTLALTLTAGYEIPTTTSLAAKAPLVSPTFTGIPLSTTAEVDNNTTQIATTAFVINQGYLKSSTASSEYQPLDSDLTAISGISATNGFLKKTSENTWSLDTNSYLTGNQTVTLSGDVSGSGTTSILVTVADDSHSHSSSTITSIDGGTSV